MQHLNFYAVGKCECLAVSATRDTFHNNTRNESHTQKKHTFSRILNQYHEDRIIEYYLLFEFRNLGTPGVKFP
jgi:hypothetical protein